MANDTQDINDRINALILGCRNLVIASLVGKDQPLSSQAPFVRDDKGNFLILVSGLAEHGKSLKNSKTVNIMLMVDEAELANPFARERLNYNCEVAMVARDSGEWVAGEQALKKRFGKFIDTLVQLPDFTLYRLTPVEGRYVAGFGAAYSIRDGVIEQVRG